MKHEQQEAKTLYKKYVTAYAQEQLGKPLEKVSVFFEGVTSEIENGRREEEIQFQQLYNKSELKKAIKQYPGKKVETGLKELYARVEKHTAEDDNRLLQVVWREMQEKFFFRKARVVQTQAILFLKSMSDASLSDFQKYNGLDHDYS